MKKLSYLFCFILLSVMSISSFAQSSGLSVKRFEDVSAVKQYARSEGQEQMLNFTLVKSTPKSTTPSSENHECVDLGLSVKWATCNVGANKPEDYGDYFAWGETKPKTTYYWVTYNWCRGSYDKLTKYNDKSSNGTIDNKTQLELSDDAARANWGGTWRMPTSAEQDELREQCTWTWTSQNGVNGYKVTSKKNGNNIFIPAAGFRTFSSLDYAGSYGYFWSSSLNTHDTDFAWYVGFYSSRVGRDFNNRYYGLSVRPVCP